MYWFMNRCIVVILLCDNDVMIILLKCYELLLLFVNVIDIVTWIDCCAWWMMWCINGEMFIGILLVNLIVIVSVVESHASWCMSFGPILVWFGPIIRIRIKYLISYGNRWSVTWGGGRDLECSSLMVGIGSKMNLSLHEWYHMHMSHHRCHESHSMNEMYAWIWICVMIMLLCMMLMIIEILLCMMLMMI